MPGKHRHQINSLRLRLLHVHSDVSCKWVKKTIVFESCSGTVNIGNRSLTCKTEVHRLASPLKLAPDVHGIVSGLDIAIISATGPVLSELKSVFLEGYRSALQTLVQLGTVNYQDTETDRSKKLDHS